MKLSDKKVLAIILLIVIALSGLIFMQFSLLRTALKAEQDSFNRAVSYALNRAVYQISQHEAQTAILQIQFDTDTLNGKQILRKETVLNHGYPDSSLFLWSNNSKIIEHDDSITVSVGYGNEREDNFINMILIDSTTDSCVQGYSYGYSRSHDSVEFFGSFDLTDSSRIMLIDAALSQLKQREQIPITDRIDSAMVDSILQSKLNESDITLDYLFWVTEATNDSIIFANVTDTSLLSDEKEYRARLFPFDFGSPMYNLIVHFPNQNFFMISKLLTIIASILIFVSIIIGCFIYSIRIILKQRRTAAHLTDFINNMTHEFKTPLSTIRRASEAIAKNEIQHDPAQLTKFNNMILSENMRMKNQVDKILQIATLEEGDYIINREIIDLHSIIAQAIDTFSVHLKNRDGRVETNFSAANPVINADPVHLNNIIHNLLDNSLKYSTGQPVITIKTENKNNKLIFTVKDNGIGIHPDDIKLVFNKYFRVSKGNIHDVKGFGLGLSYVKMMVDAHQGDITLQSVLDKGTEVIITLENA